MSLTAVKRSIEVLDTEGEFDMGYMVLSTDLSSLEGDMSVKRTFSVHWGTRVESSYMADQKSPELCLSEVFCKTLSMTLKGGKA
jgi:hypothetical protein